MTVERRMTALERTFGPIASPGCRWRGGRCAAFEVFFLSATVPPPTPAAAACPTCGRARFVRQYLIRGDADEPPAVPEAV